MVVRKYYKKFVFATILPFEVQERIIYDSIERNILEVNIINSSLYPLHINKIFLCFEKEHESLIPINDVSDFNETVIDSEDEVNLIYILENTSEYNNAVSNYYYFTH